MRTLELHLDVNRWLTEQVGIHASVLANTDKLHPTTRSKAQVLHAPTISHLLPQLLGWASGYRLLTVELSLMATEFHFVKLHAISFAFF